LAVSCLVGLAALPAHADIYQFTDKEGVVHFSNRRPHDNKYRLYVQGSGSPRRIAVANGVVPVAPTDRDPGRYTRYDESIRQAASLYQIPEQLVRAVIKCESDYDPRAVSPSGARGLMQLMPDTAGRMQVKDIDDPRENIFGGVRYLRILANLFNGDLSLTIAAYNAGDGAVMRAGGIPPYQQTREYVTLVTRFYHRYRSHQNALEASVGRD
jgi:soluble lytic murein transglycosylase-like protein